VSGPREEYLARVPPRIAGLIAGREEEVEAAIVAGARERLERIQDQVNALRIDERPVGAEEVEIAGAPSAEEIGEEIRGGEGAGTETRGEARERILEGLFSGRVVSELFFAGAATRFAKVASGPLYFLDIWEIAERVLGTNPLEAPKSWGVTPEEFARIRELLREREAAARLPEERRRRIPLGPRILLAYRSALERLAGLHGESPAAARSRARFVVHVPDTPDGRRIQADLWSRRFLGFDPANFLLIPQPFFGGWEVRGGAVTHVAGSREFPCGHGYSTMQLVQPGAAFLPAVRKEGLEEREAWMQVSEDALSFLGRGGDFLLRVQRVNDLTQISPASLDLERLAAARRLLDRGHGAVFELVANPHHQKGGNWVALQRRGGDEHRFLIEGMNAKVNGWPEFLERHRGAPYNAFRNIYDGAHLRRILLDHTLPDHLRIRDSGPGRPGLYLESVTGDLTQIRAARAAAFQKDKREEIHDLKELKDLPEGLAFAVAQDRET